ncbi:CvpA family protein [Bergeriella denitrificans]|uniref:Bacteriocin production protein n=1 Tax=Bergeriella denitrificans TaxID=494 RepID=A0A378UEW4_BERDE|nr:CvpA family protein [Bergeriella denitrificans]STZ75845.1 bacteriocin production protein [Bergeriella denitrificans]
MGSIFGGIPIADILAFAVVAACAFMSMMRGVVAEVGSLVAWVAAFAAARWFAVPFSELAFPSMEPRALGVALSFVMVFFAAWFAQRFLRSLLTAAISALGLGGANRLLGGVFGTAKGILLVTLVVMVCSFTELPASEAWQRSYSIPYFEALSQAVMPYLPYGGATAGFP